MPRPAVPHARRLTSLLLLLAFVATGQGVAALELAWHVGHVEDQHERAPHAEAAGGGSHGDNCQLTVGHTDGRLPVLPGAAALPACPAALLLAGPADPLPGAGRTAPTQSRAPPIPG